MEKEKIKMVEVDARGFSCPVPVVMVKKAIEQNPEEPVTVLVETAVSKENVSRLAKSQHYSVEIEETGDEFRLILKPSAK
jgi:tRNA 2-thiouridine synthesizing protein A